MKHVITLIILVSFLLSAFAFGAKKPADSKSHRKTASSSTKSNTKISKKKWNKVCKDLLDTSVKSTLKLEKAVNKKKKISKVEFDNKIQNELMVVQLNAWVCALSSGDQAAVAAEELFLKDYSKLVQSKQL